MTTEPAPSLKVWRLLVALCAVAAFATAVRVATADECRGGVVVFDADGAPAPGCVADTDDETTTEDLGRVPALAALAAAGLALAGIAIAWPRFVRGEEAEPPTPEATADDATPHDDELAETTRRFCTACGAPLAEDARFCGACGAEVVQT